MAKRDKPPQPMVRKLKTGLSPVTPYDAEELDGFVIGTEFDLIPRTKRSPPQLRTYWKTLGAVVAATGTWPTREALHRALKMECGMVVPIYDMCGHEDGFTLDSIALDDMPHKEFCAYFDMAMGKLSEAVGFDVLAWYSQ